MLLRSRGFTATDFRGFHPGGKLGAALRRVADLMHRDRELPLCAEQTPLVDAVAKLTSAGFGIVGVVDDSQRLVGVLTDGDLRRLFGQDVSRGPISQVMTRSPRTVFEETLVGEALARLNDGRITALFVVDRDGRVGGLLHVHDCLQTGIL